MSFQSGHDDNIPWPLLMRILSQTNSPSGTKWLCSIKVQTQYQVSGIGTPKWNAALRLILAALDFDQSNCRPVYFMTFYVKDIYISIAYLQDFFIDQLMCLMGSIMFYDQIKETRRALKDSESGLEKMAIGHHIQDRGHVVEKKFNKKTGEKEFNQDFQNMDECTLK